MFIPLSFDPGEAFQFDWIHEWVQMAGMPVKTQVTHIRLCHSRMFLTVAYPRETREMVLDAHQRAFDFFGGICRRGIYDNLKTVVNKILFEDLNAILNERCISWVKTQRRQDRYHADPL